MLWILIAILLAAADQFTKYLVVRNIKLGEQVPVINNFFYLTYIKNKGAAFSILQNGRLVFLLLTPVVAIFLIYFIFKSKSRFLKLALSMILGGAMGNYIDRLFIGSVTDFFSFRFGSYPFAIFNLGDSIICIGTALLAIYLLFIYKEPVKKEAAKEDKVEENAGTQDEE